jgi:hypothetical protein
MLEESRTMSLKICKPTKTTKDKGKTNSFPDRQGIRKITSLVKSVCFNQKLLVEFGYQIFAIF